MRLVVLAFVPLALEGVLGHAKAVVVLTQNDRESARADSFAGLPFEIDGQPFAPPHVEREAEASWRGAHGAFQ
jgi:hypothetical protein